MGYAKTPAQAEQVLRIAFEVTYDGFEMVKTFNFYSGKADVIFERLVQYDYLANPVKLVPSTAESMPTIQDNKKVYIFKIKPGILQTIPHSKVNGESQLLKIIFIQLNVF